MIRNVYQRRESLPQSVKTGVILTALLTLLAACRPGEPTALGEGPPDGSDVTIRLWSQVNEPDFWRVDGPARVSAEIERWNVTVDGVKDSAPWEEYKRKVTLAAEAGEAPDIVISGHEDAAPWSQAGYIVPFDECRAAHPEFGDVFDSLWASATFDGRVWGVPSETEARPMFYHKQKLAELGWSQEEIDGLQGRIDSGEFTLDDVIETARQAVEAGVVPEGFGYWHRPQQGFDFIQYYVAYGGRLYDEAENKMVVTRDAVIDWYAFQRRVVEEGITPRNYIGTEWDVWHQTVAGGEALFWNGGIWQWAEWLANYVPDQDEEYLFDFVGWALQPSGRAGEPGVTLSHPLLYMITSPQASGANNQAPACELLAKTMNPEINTLHAVESAHLGILNSQLELPEYQEAEFLAATTYMVDAPGNFVQPNHEMYGPYFQALFDSMVRAANGDVTPEQGADEAIRRLEAEIPEAVIFE